MGQITPKTRFWIGVACKTHVERGVQLGICQFCRGSAQAAARISKNDWIAYYSPRVTMKPDSTSIRSFTAIGVVADNNTYQADDDNGFSPWRRNVKYLSAKPVPIIPLLPQLPFIKDKSKWGSIFRPGLVEICQQSFDVIRHEMITDLSH